MMERERMREPEANLDSRYDQVLRQRSEFIERQMTGQLVVHSKDLKYHQARQGRLKHFLSDDMTYMALNNWSVFEQDIRRQSGRHRHQGGIIIYVIEGEGTTEVDGKYLKWQAGDLLLLPIQPNGVAHQHFNKETDKGCRWVAFRHHGLRDHISHSITQLEESPDYRGVSSFNFNVNSNDRAETNWKAQVNGDQVPLVTHPDQLAQENMFDKLVQMRDLTRARLRQGTWLIRGAELPWEWNQHGKMQWFLHPCIAYSVVQTNIFYRQEIPVGSRSGQQRHGGDVVFYILRGEGYTEVDGVRHAWQTNDVMTLPIRPDGVVYRHVNAGREPVLMIGVEPNFVHAVGVDRHSGFEELQPCPEYANRHEKGDE